jgi:protein-tyrosine-phosphatase
MRRILFLCTGNYYRSRFAEVLFNHLAKEKGLDWAADSCGLNIAALGQDNPGPMSRLAREGLKARGLEVAEPAHWPRQVGEADLAAADVVVAVKEAEHRPLMMKLHPAWVERVRYWHVHDLDGASPEVALAELEQLVKGLVDELASQPRMYMRGYVRD